LELGPQNAWLLLVELQRAWHLSRGYGRELVERIARELQARYCPPGTVLGALAATGWEDESILPFVTSRWSVPEAFRRSFEPDGGAAPEPRDAGE
jgi:hypothetical protein